MPTDCSSPVVILQLLKKFADWVVGP